MLKDEDRDWFDMKTRTRLFWILVVSERAHGVRRNRPITLSVTSSSYPLDGHDDLGLVHLASVFRPLDEVFFAVWNGAAQNCSKEWLIQLENDVRTALPTDLELSNEEIANVRISQFWLQIKLWELFPRFGFLSTESVYDCLTFRYPILVGKDLTILSMKLPVQSLQIHGVGMTEKVFDIACALADVLHFVPQSASHAELSPQDYLTQLMLLIAKLPGGSSKFIPLLLAKVNELLPDLLEHVCEAIQMPIPTNHNPMSPDTRFVYEEEVGRGLHADLRRTF
ncbi:uncharacterized protein J4E79_002981 [Alternaria viburni]|uniref:uncharacterized protein n=1 Tax=Alternaria viburni TaxID=566460 RepID=UPI0020C2A9A2|nr:uncharacterized protein J4E79_002981 [Alternaria viburni]KAI4664683.1 hypothetical protein J4E79_002981 [Alternaria viburni]